MDNGIWHKDRRGFGHRPKNQKHASALIVAVEIPLRRDMKIANQLREVIQQPFSNTMEGI